jgi:hypothetical protein
MQAILLDLCLALGAFGVLNLFYKYLKNSNASS